MWRLAPFRSAEASWIALFQAFLRLYRDRDLTAQSDGIERQLGCLLSRSRSDRGGAFGAERQHRAPSESDGAASAFCDVIVFMQPKQNRKEKEDKRRSGHSIFGWVYQLRAHEFWSRPPFAAWGLIARRIRHSCRYRKERAFDKAEAVLENVRLKHPSHAGIAIEFAEIATARHDWPSAIRRWQGVIDLLADAAPAHAYVSLGRAYDKQRNFAAADAVFEAGCCKFPHDLRIAVDRSKLRPTGRIGPRRQSDGRAWCKRSAMRRRWRPGPRSAKPIDDRANLTSPKWR